MVKKNKKKSFYGRLSYTNKKTLWGIIFLTPWIIGMLLFFLGPLCKTFFYAFFNMTLDKNGFTYSYVGFDNFKYALTVNPDFNQKLITSLLDVVQNVPIQIFVSLFIAILLNSKFKGRGFFRLVFFIPIILATGILSLELKDVAISQEQSQGFINSIFEVITVSGVQMLIFLAGLQGISSSLYEVAKIEGCSAFESFCKITFPMISPMILVCLIYSLADTFMRADISQTISDITFKSAKYGLGAAMSAIFFLVSMAVILIVSLIVSKGVFYYDK